MAAPRSAARIPSIRVNGTINSATQAITVRGPSYGQFNSTLTNVATGVFTPVAVDTHGDQYVRPAGPTAAAWSHTSGTTAASGATQIVTTVAGQTVRVMKINVVVQGANNVYVADTTPTQLSALYVLTANGSAYTDFANGEPLWVTASGKGLALNFSTTATATWDVWYTQS